MLHRKLLEVLKLLNSTQKARLRLFLQSPYFNQRSNAAVLLQFYDYVVSIHPDETDARLSKGEVYEKFFPGKPFKEGEKGPLDVISSDLFLLVKKFLAQSAWESRDQVFEEGMAVARFYRRFGLDERFWQVITGLRKHLNAQTIRDADFFEKLFFLEEEAAAIESLNNKFEDDANISTAARNLDIAYALKKLELMCLLNYQQKLSQAVNFNPDEPLAQAALELPPDFPQVDQHVLYRLAFTLIQNPEDDAAFANFESHLEEKRHLIAFENVRNLKGYYRFLLNRRYTKIGGAEYRNKMFSVYKAHYEQGFFYEGNDIMINSLKVLILFGLRQKEFEWVKKVLDKHPPSRICGTKYPAEAYNLCLAEYHFYKKEYITALSTLVYRHFENANFSIWSEMLLIKIYFETGDDLLEYRMKALEQKVRRSKLSTESKSRYYRFLQKLEKIIKYGGDKKSQKKEKLIEEIKRTAGINEREWLLEKLTPQV